MKIYVLYEFKVGPYGGANQFLKAMRDYFLEKGYLVNKLEDADVILFNSSNDTERVLKAKRTYPNKIFVERLDGPARLYVYQPKRDKRDLIANIMNYYIADATIFQSEYSREANYQLGLNHNLLETTIMNAPDELIFNKKGKSCFKSSGKIRLIASSWSANWNKGFDTYKFLDENLDFDRYGMFFVGNSPIEFKHIQKISPMESKELADMMKTCDIYITASENDPCSNSLIEAIFCGLPAIALKKGGHPEIVGKAGRMFEKKEEIPLLLEEVVHNYELLSNASTLIGRDETAVRYIQFLEEVFSNQKKNKGKAKRVNIFQYSFIQIILLYIKVYNKFWNIVKSEQLGKIKDERS